MLVKGFQSAVNGFQFIAYILLFAEHIPEYFIKPRNIHNLVAG